MCVHTEHQEQQTYRQTQAHAHEHTHTFRYSSHPHISCVFHVQWAFLLFFSFCRGSTGLMTFPMRHKHSMWEADSHTAHVLMCKMLCIYVWAREELDTWSFFYVFVRGCFTCGVVFFFFSFSIFAIFIFTFVFSVKSVFLWMCFQQMDT